MLAELWQGSHWQDEAGETREQQTDLLRKSCSKLELKLRPLPLVPINPGFDRV